MTFYLLFILYLFWIREMMLDKKQFWGTFLFQFKISPKAVARTHSINNSFRPGIANEPTVQWWFKKFCKGDSCLEDEEHSGQPSEVDNDQLIGSSKLILLKLHEKLLKNSASIILWSFGIWGKLERWIKLDKSVPHELTANQKNYQFEVLSSLIVHNNNEPSLDQIVTCDEKWILCDNQLSGWTERKLQALLRVQLTPETGHGHCLMVCCWCDPLQLYESRWTHYIWEVCSVDQWDSLKTAVPVAGFDQQNGLNSSPWQRPHPHCTTNTWKFKWTVLRSFASSAISPDLSPTDNHFFKHLDNFLQRKCFHNQQEAENAFQVFVESWNVQFYIIGINKLSSHWQKCVDCSGSSFD